MSFTLLGFVSCGSSGGGGDDGGDDDRTRITVGEWTSVSLTADVESGAMTDRKDFIAEVPAGKYVVEYRNLNAGIAAQDFVWYLGAVDNLFASGNEGQEADDAVDLDAGDCWITIDNDASVAMSCQFRLVLLSDSGFFIPNEGTENNPVVLTVGPTAHTGKVGIWPDDGDYATSWYTFTTGGVVANYTVTVNVTNGTDIPTLSLHKDNFSTTQLSWSGSGTLTGVNLSANTKYCVKAQDSSALTRPTYTITVDTP